MSLHNPRNPLPPSIPLFTLRKEVAKWSNFDWSPSTPSVSHIPPNEGKLKNVIQATDVVRWDKCSNDYLIHNLGNYPDAPETFPGIFADFN